MVYSKGWEEWANLSGLERKRERITEGVPGALGQRRTWMETEWDRKKTAENILVITDVFAEFVNNSLPIYLICLHDMKIMSRSQILLSAKSRIDGLAGQPQRWAMGPELLDLPIKEYPYAILSHRWLDGGEVDFNIIGELSKLDMSGIEGSTILEKMVQLLSLPDQLHLKLKELHNCSSSGLAKLVRFCHEAYQQGCRYAWVDTCCINKQSSSELEESIRSMFKWYRNSAICIVHLSSTTSPFDLPRDPWFKRGWTLQELLAPTRIKFFDSSWSPMLSSPNNKQSPGNGRRPNWLLQDVSQITSISIENLQNFTPGTHNIRQTMQWMSERRTTRIEDMAYCLLGIFDVNLSISYGEGTKAFYRLQVELLQTSDDRGVFLWTGKPSPWNSMLAASPKGFDSDESLLPVDAYLGSNQLDPTSAMTNYGLRIMLSVYDIHRWYQGDSSKRLFCLDVRSRDLVVPVPLPVNNLHGMNSHADDIESPTVDFSDLTKFKCALLGKYRGRGENERDTEARREFICILLESIPGTSPLRYKRVQAAEIRINIPEEALKPPQVVFIVADSY